MAKQQQKLVAVLALLLCAASVIVQSNGFTFPVFSAQRAFRELSRTRHAPAAGPSVSPTQPPSGSGSAPAPAPAALVPVVTPAAAHNGPAMNPALSPVTTAAHAPAPTPTTRAPSPEVPALHPPTPTPAPMAGLLPVTPSANSPAAPAPAPVLPLPPSPAPVLPLPPSAPATATAATPPSEQVSAPPPTNLVSGAAGIAASTGFVLVSAVAAMAL